jgi:hypothetical protein
VAAPADPGRERTGGPRPAPRRADLPVRPHDRRRPVPARARRRARADQADPGPRVRGHP